MEGEKEADLGLGERSEADAHADALGESPVAGLGKPVTEEGLAAEDHGEGAASVEVVGGEQAEILQGVVGEQVGLVNEQDGASGEGTQMTDEGRSSLAFEPPGFQPDRGSDSGEQAEGREGGQGEDHEVVVRGVEGLGEQGKGGGLAASALGDQECDGVAFEGETQAGEDLLEPAVVEDGLVGGHPREGLGGEAEVLLEGGHPFSPLGVGGLGFAGMVRARTTWPSRAWR